MLAEETPDSKLQLSGIVGAIIATAAVVISLLCHLDPWGGASLSLDTLQVRAGLSLCCSIIF